MPKLLIIANQSDARYLHELLQAYRDKGYEAEGVLMVQDKANAKDPKIPGPYQEPRSYKYACFDNLEVHRVVEEFKPDGILCSRSAEFTEHVYPWKSPRYHSETGAIRAVQLLHYLRDAALEQPDKKPKIVFNTFNIRNDEPNAPGSGDVTFMYELHPVEAIDRMVRKSIQKDGCGSHVAALAAEQRAMFSEGPDQYSRR